MNRKALVVGDNVSNRVALGLLLERFGIEVIQAKSGAEAVDIYLSDRSFDLVVLNVDMPGMNGFKTAELIRNYQIAKRPVIVGTVANLAHAEKAKCAAIDMYVVKSLSISNPDIFTKIPFTILNGGAR